MTDSEKKVLVTKIGEVENIEILDKIAKIAEGIAAAEQARSLETEAVDGLERKYTSRSPAGLGFRQRL